MKVGAEAPAAGAAAQASADALPLTESQTEIWLASQLGDEASCAYNEPFFMRLKGPLKVDALRAAVNSTLARHEALHARFDRDGQEQTFTAPAPLDIPIVDADAERLDALLARHATQPFDLERGPLVRMELARLGDDEHVLICAAHHIVCDGWSWSVLIQEIGKRYSATIKGEGFAPEEAGRFSDYVLDERGSEEVEDSYGYWVEQFATPPAPLQLPTDRPRPAFKSSRGATVHHVFDPSVYVAAKKLASDLQVSLFSLTMGAFNLLMARLAGQDDIVVAMPTAGQLNYGEDHLVGHCVNLLPLRTRLQHDTPVRQYLKYMTGNVLDAFENNACTLGGILQRLALPRNPGRIPLAEVQFNLDRDDRGVAFHNLSMEIQQAPRHAVTFDLFFNLNEMKSGFVVDLDYNADLFDEATIRRWIGYFERLVVSMSERPDGAIGELRMVSADEEDLYETQRSAAETAFPAESPVHELFEEQVEVSPDKVAVTFEATSLTYRELDEYANQFARFLQTMDIAPESVVGVHMERSAGMLVALLGILKAGAAYVPLDPAYPQSRIQHMIGDSGLRVLLTENEQLQTLDTAAFPEGLQVVSMDDEWGKINKRSKNKPRVDLSPESLAYMIYTSGSTGQPKGVEITHRSLVNLLHSMQNEPGIEASDVMLNVTTLSFDIAALELFLPLITGASLVILPHEKAMDGRLLDEAIDQYGVTVAQATPAMWRMLIEAGWNGKRDLTVFCGGEALSPTLARQLLERCDALWNMYGPTETTIWSSVHRVSASDATISIGKPIANTQFYVLDAHRQVVPMGATGELYIGGAGLARGYRNPPDLPRARFGQSPCDAGARLYRPGALARILPDGTFECLGRSDAQVKIRGFRIELGEVETHLAEVAGVAECAVIRHQEPDGEAALAAYVAASNGATLTASGIRSTLQERLPAYMVPTFVVPMDALPKTPNGKLDRAALPAPQLLADTADETTAPPQTPMEKALAEIWHQVLGIASVGIHDNFFDVGGHSLQATRVIARLRAAMHVDFPLRTFFEKPTIAEQALAVLQLQNGDEDDDILTMIEELEGLTAAEIAAQLNQANS